MRSVSMLILVVCLFTSIVRAGEFGAEPSRNAWPVMDIPFLSTPSWAMPRPLFAPWTSTMTGT